MADAVPRSGCWWTEAIPNGAAEDLKKRFESIAAGFEPF